MTVKRESISLKTGKQGDMVNITEEVGQAIAASGLSAGIALIFCPGATGALSTVEFEPGLQKDIPDALQKIAPYGRDYAHHGTWGDDNGSGHVQATILGPDITVPFEDGVPILGNWQQIVFIECDTRARERKLVVQIIGE